MSEVDISSKTRIDGLESRLSRMEAQLQDVLSAPTTVKTRPGGYSARERETTSPELKLPPIDKVVPIVDLYFSHFNSAIPLFHQPAFMRMLNDWYSGVHPSRRPKAV